MKHTNKSDMPRINREPLTWWESVRFSLATRLMRIAVYVVAPVKRRGNLDLLFELGAASYAEERERQVREEFYARVGRGSQRLHRAGDSDTV